MLLTSGDGFGIMFSICSNFLWGESSEPLRATAAGDHPLTKRQVGSVGKQDPGLSAELTVLFEQAHQNTVRLCEILALIAELVGPFRAMEEVVS